MSPRHDHFGCTFAGKAWGECSATDGDVEIRLSVSAILGLFLSGIDDQRSGASSQSSGEEDHHLWIGRCLSELRRADLGVIILGMCAMPSERMERDIRKLTPE